jgi:hypothetical protein
MGLGGEGRGREKMKRDKRRGVKLNRVVSSMKSKKVHSEHQPRELPSSYPARTTCPDSVTIQTSRFELDKNRRNYKLTY